MRGLATVCEQEAGKRVAQPADLHGTPSEGANVGKECLHPSETWQDAREAAPPLKLIANEVIERVVGVKSPCQPGTSVHRVHVNSISHVILRHLLTHLGCVYNRSML